MMRSLMSVAAVLTAAGTAAAHPVLQFDVNSFRAQSMNSSGVPAAFGGVSHTGSVAFSAGQGALAGVFIQTAPAGPFNNAGLSSSFSMTGFTGEVELVNGMVTGGNLALALNNGDTYTAQISGVGSVSTFVGGGFTIQALTHGGLFSDAMFGNVNIAEWFNSQGVNGLLGSLLQFNFRPDAQGLASSDMDIFVDAAVIPLPPAAYMGLATMAGVIAVRRLRRG